MENICFKLQDRYNFAFNLYQFAKEKFVFFAIQTVA